MISIITPVLNGAEFIEKNIKSIEKLTIPFEHIIVDGGSTDGTIEILNSYSHLKIIHQKDKNGMYGAISLGFEIALYDYITWVNSDDLIYHENFEFALAYASKNSIDFAYGDGLFNWSLVSKKTFHKANPYAKYFLRKGILPFLQPSSFYSKKIYDNIKFRFDTFKIAGDLDFFMRIASQDSLRFWYCRKPMTEFLKYGESLGDKNHLLYLKEKKQLSKNPNLLDLILFNITKKF